MMSIEKVIIPIASLVPAGCALAQNVHSEVKQKEVKHLSKEEIQKKVCSITSGILGVSTDDIKGGMDFTDDLGGDSLDLVEMIMACEKEFDISISDEKAEKIKTINQAVELIYSLLPKDAVDGVTTNQDEWKKQYDEVVQLKNGLHLAVKYTKDKQSFGDFVVNYQEGQASGQLVGLLDKYGNELTPVKYEWVMFFSEELAPVRLNGKWGYIDVNGIEVIKPKYDDWGYFHDGLAIVGLNGKHGIITQNDKIVIPFKYDFIEKFEDSLYKVTLNDKTGLIDRKGNIIIGLKYYSIRSFNEDVAIVVNFVGELGLESKWGYIDRYGKEIIPLKYDRAESFNNGIAAVMVNDKWGYIDKSGKEVIPLKYDDVRPSFLEGLASVKLNNKWGFIDKTDKEVIPLKYDDAGSFSEDIAEVSLNGNWLYIDKLGNEYATEEEAREAINNKEK
jgi:acyl carrier protein